MSGINFTSSSRVPVGWDRVEGGGEVAVRVARPYIVSFPAGTGQVVVNHSDCRTATDWTREYFSLGAVRYVCSDFEGNHTFECSVLAPVVTNA